MAFIVAIRALRRFCLLRRVCFFFLFFSPLDGMRLYDILSLALRVRAGCYVQRNVYIVYIENYGTFGNNYCQTLCTFHETFIL